jgi:hypothetical protein
VVTYTPRPIYPACFVWEARGAKEIIWKLYKRAKYFSLVGNGNKIVHPKVSALYLLHYSGPPADPERMVIMKD